MKNVLIVDVGEAYGGIEKFIYNVYSHINHNLIHIDFLIFSEHCAYENYYIEKSKIFKVTSRRIDPIKHKKEICNFFKSHKYDSVWIQTCSASNITSHLMAKRYSNAQIISHAHVAKAERKGLLHDCIAATLHFINRQRLNKVTDIRLACSKEAAAYLFGKKYVSMTRVVNNGIDLSSYKVSEKYKTVYRQEFGINGDDLVIGHVGRFSKVKNHELIVKIFYELQKKIDKSKLVLVGDGEEKAKIENLVKELHIDSKVVFTGVRNDIPQLLSILNVFLFPSFNEGFGISAIEAQAAGVPVLMSDSLCQELIVSNGCKAISIKAPIISWVDEIIRMKNFKLSTTRNIDLFDIRVTTEEIEMIIGK